MNEFSLLYIFYLFYSKYKICLGNKYYVEVRNMSMKIISTDVIRNHGFENVPQTT